MFAIVRTGGKQYRVAADQTIIVDRMDGEVGDAVSLDDVLMMGEGGDLKDASKEVVHAEILEQARARKIKVFKKKRRQGYQRTRGHRQQLTVLKITALGGKAPAKSAAKKATPAKDSETRETSTAASDTAKVSDTAKASKPAAAEKKVPAKAAVDQEGRPGKGGQEGAGEESSQGDVRREGGGYDRSAEERPRPKRLPRKRLPRKSPPQRSRRRRNPATRNEEFEPWHIKRQAAPPATAATLRVSGWA